MLFAEAVKIVTTELSRDNLRRLTYVANITYEIDSAWSRYCDGKVTARLTKPDVHAIAKKAAENFLDMWLLNADKEDK